MQKKENCLKLIKSFRSKHAIETSDENIIATIHLMNTHGVDANTALDQSSRSGNDHGIDAWYYNEVSKALFIYQSKLTESKTMALRGFGDLDYAKSWLEKVIIDGIVDQIPNDNHCLFNLYTTLGRVRLIIKKVCFVLISPFDSMELEDAQDYINFQSELIKSKLNSHFHQNLNGKLGADVSDYNLEYGIPSEVKVYPINKIPDAQIDLRKNANLDLAYVTLYSLVELFRQRGNILFDKNVRLSLNNTKEGRERLVHPMEMTLDMITSGKLSPNIFPFYHIGITLAATSASNGEMNLLNLEAPSIINGCQTITISNEYLKRLEKQQNEEAINLFKEIKVIAKVVVGITNDELKEITNSNNRQNPIENWQLFSNEPIHIEIEATLKDLGVFYERQKGKFDSVMKNIENAKYYSATNGTFLSVVDVGQLIALSRKMLQWAAKPSEIFLNRENHDKIFDRDIPKYPKDLVFTSNMFKALKRGLNKYLELPVHANSSAPQIFKKQPIRNNIYFLALIYFYQADNKFTLRNNYSISLMKKASQILVDETQPFYQKVITKTKNWYTIESKNLEIEVSKKRTDDYFRGLAIELGINISDGVLPFSATAIDWSECSHD
ncbi:MAG: AIPR family protein [Ignavibacteriales bacterium]|nr:AIPR family protein [Ignavibacteriales bacterium]